MMTAVILSIQGKWCELIASGKKMIEVRKTRPKTDTPFKCYIYETKGSHGIGKVVGEFVCDAIFPISVKYSDVNSRIALREFYQTGLTDKEIIDYLGNGVEGYGWHISDLVIYKKPQELSEYLKPCTFGGPCGICEYFYDYDCFNQIKHPPQSWCYTTGRAENVS